MMQEDTRPRNRRPHPVQLEIDYPERLSRIKALFKWLLIIPHFIAVYLLMIAVLARSRRHQLRGSERVARPVRGVRANARGRGGVRAGVSWRVGVDVLQY